MDGREDAWHHREQEACFLVRNCGEESDPRDRAEEGKMGWIEGARGPWEEEKGRTEEEGQ